MWRKIPAEFSSNWKTKTHALPGTMHELRISYPENESWWEEQALKFWEKALPGLEQIPASRQAKVYRAALPETKLVYYFKYYQIRDKRDWLKHQVIPSRAKRALFHGLLLEKYAFQTPKSCCLIEERRFGFTTASGLITEELANAAQLRVAIHDSASALSFDKREQFLQALAQEVGRLHTQGIYHGDMQATNLLCRELENSFSFFWIDNERTKQCKKLPLALRIKNLRQLSKIQPPVSRRDRLMFWKEYRQAAALAPAEQAAILHGLKLPKYRTLF